MADTIIFEFMAFYFGTSIALIILYLMFKSIIKRYWFLYLPMIFAGIVFFPYGLVMFGYNLRIYDERREKRKFYSESMEDNFESTEFDPDVDW